MLILVAVTVTVAKDGGLFETARTAKTGTQKEADRENLVAAAVGAYDARSQEVKEEELKQNLGNEWRVENQTNYYKVTSPNGNEFKVNIKNATVEDNTGGTGGDDVPSESQITIAVGSTMPAGCCLTANEKELKDEITGKYYIAGDIYAASEEEVETFYNMKKDTDLRYDYKGSTMPSIAEDSGEKILNDTTNGIAYITKTNNGNITGWFVEGRDLNQTIISRIFVQIGDVNLTDIQNSFQGKTDLKQIPKLPMSITNISGCFSGCTALKEVTYLGTIEQFKQIDGYATCGDSGLVIHCTDGDYTVQ